MPNIKVSELAFLMSLRDKLITDDEYTMESGELNRIIDRLNAVKEISNSRTAASIAERRKTDYLYCRTAKERKQILSRKKQPSKKVCEWQICGSFKADDGSDFEELIVIQPTKHDAQRFIKMNPELISRYESVRIQKHFIKEGDQNDTEAEE